MKTKLAALLLLLALLFLPMSGVYAQGPGGDIIRIGEDYTLESGETLNGSLVVIGGNADVQEDSLVTRDVVLIGGNLTIDGNTDGTVVIIGGNVTISGSIGEEVVVIGGQLLLTETSVVNGDVVTMGGQVTKEPGAEVTGNMVNNAPLVDIPDVPGAPNVPNVPNVPNTSYVDVGFSLLWKAVNVILFAFAVAAISMLLTLFLQPQLERVGDTIIRQPLLAGSFGLLTLVAAPIVLVILTVTLILIPVAIIVAFVIPLAWLFGIIAIGQEVGERFTKAINQTWAPVLSTGFGTFLLLLVGGSVGFIPCAGWLLQFVAGLIAVGGVAMTWFGTRAAPGAMPPSVIEVPAASPS